MSAIFGRTKSQQNADNSNVFGEPSKTREKDKEQEAQTENVEQAPKGEQPVNQQPVQGEEGSSGQSEQQEAQSTQQQQEEEKKLAGKFKDRNSLLEGVKNLSDKLGRKIDPVKVRNSTTEELVEVYQEAEKELGKTADVDKTRQENQQLKQELNKYRQELQQTKQQMNQINRYLQNMNQRQQTQAQPQQMNQQQGQSQPISQSQPQQADNSQMVRDPQTGKFVKRQPQQNSQQQNNQDNQQQIDPDKWLRKFYKDPVSAINEINQMNNQQQAQIKDNMNPQQQQDFRQQKQNTEEQQRQQYRQRLQQIQDRHFSTKVKEMEQKYGEDFDNPETKREVMKYMRNHRVYLNPNLFPDGLERAYKEVKKHMANRNNNQSQQQNNEEIENQKKAAQLPKNNRRNIVQADEGEQAENIKQNIFGSGGGIFGR